MKNAATQRMTDYLTHLANHSFDKKALHVKMAGIQKLSQLTGSLNSGRNLTETLKNVFPRSTESWRTKISASLARSVVRWEARNKSAHQAKRVKNAQRLNALLSN